MIYCPECGSRNLGPAVVATVNRAPWWVRWCLDRCGHVPGFLPLRPLTPAETRQLTPARRTS